MAAIKGKKANETKRRCIYGKMCMKELSSELMQMPKGFEKRSINKVRNVKAINAKVFTFIGRSLVGLYNRNLQTNWNYILNCQSCLGVLQLHILRSVDLTKGKRQTVEFGDNLKSVTGR